MNAAVTRWSLSPFRYKFTFVSVWLMASMWEGALMSCSCPETSFSLNSVESCNECSTGSSPEDFPTAAGGVIALQSWVVEGMVIMTFRMVIVEDGAKHKEFDLEPEEPTNNNQLPTPNTTQSHKWSIFQTIYPEFMQPNSYIPLCTAKLRLPHLWAINNLSDR